MTSTYLHTFYSSGGWGRDGDSTGAGRGGGGGGGGGGAGGGGSYAVGLQISDYEKLMRDLHSANTNLIFLLNVLSFEAEFGAFCGRLFEEFEDLRRRMHRRMRNRRRHLKNENTKGGKKEAKNKKKRFHGARARDEFRQHLAYCVDASRFRLKQTQSLRLRVESQINVVSFLFSFFLSSSSSSSSFFFPSRSGYQGSQYGRMKARKKATKTQNNNAGYANNIADDDYDDDDE